MYYCKPCIMKAGIIPPFWQTYRACDSCGKFDVVYDHSNEYKLPDNAPCITEPVYCVKPYNPYAKAAMRPFGIHANPEKNFIA